MADDDLRDFTRTTFTHGGETRDIYRQGSGPAVIVIAEMPGITPNVAKFARRVVELGCTAVMPHLFGTPGTDVVAKGRFGALRHGLGVMVPACISREFTVWSTGQTSPVVTWLRALAAHEHEQCGGPGVGAIGMCFTGGYALAMATDDRLLAPVLSQPSMPVAATPGRARNIDISPEDLAKVKHRCASQGLQVIGLRFKGDRMVPQARFDFLREQLGDAFIGIEIDDKDAAKHPLMPPHSVVTEHLIDEPGQPTRDALDQVLDLFRTRLLAAA